MRGSEGNGVCQIKHLGWGERKTPERRKADGHLTKENSEMDNK